MTFIAKGKRIHCKKYPRKQTKLQKWDLVQKNKTKQTVTKKPKNRGSKRNCDSNNEHRKNNSQTLKIFCCSLTPKPPQNRAHTLLYHKRADEGQKLKSSTVMPPERRKDIHG